MATSMKTREVKKFTFGKKGDKVTGKLLKIQEMQGDRNNYIRYTVQQRNESGEETIVTFNGNFQIDDKIFQTDIGKNIEVLCTGVDARGYKQYDVAVETFTKTEDTSFNPE